MSRQRRRKGVPRGQTLREQAKAAYRARQKELNAAWLAKRTALAEQEAKHMAELQRLGLQKATEETDLRCPECGSSGFPPSKTGKGCTFCDGTEGGNPPVFSTQETGT